jgi:hypothetical protein
MVGEFVDDVLPQRRRFVVARRREVGGELGSVKIQVTNSKQGDKCQVSSGMPISVKFQAANSKQGASDKVQKGRRRGALEVLKFECCL